MCVFFGIIFNKVQSSRTVTLLFVAANETFTKDFCHLTLTKVCTGELESQSRRRAHEAIVRVLAIPLRIVWHDVADEYAWIEAVMSYVMQNVVEY